MAISKPYGINLYILSCSGYAMGHFISEGNNAQGFNEIAIG